MQKKQQDVLLVGAGNMAIEYAKVLDGLKKDYLIVGRGEASAARCQEQTGHEVLRGGIEEYLKKAASLPEYAIITVYPLSLKAVTERLLEAGVKKILVEKPAGINREEIAALCDCAGAHHAEVFVAYNRRFYASVEKAMRLIQEDGGVVSFNFEFTEWSHRIETLDKPAQELENWFMANSTHVVDLAFFLGGEPEQISTFVKGKLPWYSKASAFSGAGVAKGGAIFSYKANWESAGRWSLEVLTRNRKLLFEPLEQLKVQNRGSVQVEPADIDDDLDVRYKAGLYRQTEAFLSDRHEKMIGIKEQKRRAEIYELMETTGNR